MNSVKFFRPRTGADSVPFPGECHQDLDGPDTPQLIAAWKRYWADREEAARRETADEAIVRCRDEAEMCDGGAARFDLVLDCIVHTFDRHLAELQKPEEQEVEQGMGLDQVCGLPVCEVSQLACTHQEMSDAFDDLDRNRYRKAAAEFARIIADFAMGMRVAETSKQEGQA